MLPWKATAVAAIAAAPPLAAAPRESRTCVDSPCEEVGTYPTVAKERAKERKRQGIEVKKK